jgi:type II secretory pathway component PulF
MIQETSGRSVVVTGLLLAAAAALWVALVAALLFIVPRYEHAFRDRGMRLPAPTQWAVTAGRWAKLYWYVLPLFGLLVLPVVFLPSWLLRHRARGSLPGWLWFGALLGIPVLLQLGMWWALLLP